MQNKASEPSRVLERAGYELEVEDAFAGHALDTSLWLASYLPQWSSRSAAAARYSVEDGALQLRIDADQGPWCREYDGELRVSSLQTGVFAGPLGSTVGQHRFRDGLVVREAQRNTALYAPTYGLFEARVKAVADPGNMVALWLIGYEDEPHRSAEICILEIFGRDVGPHVARVGMGLHPFSDPSIRDDFERITVTADVRGWHDYAAQWTPEWVAFYVDDQLMKVVGQSPAYPMQFMIGIYEFVDDVWPASAPADYPKMFEVRWFRGYRPSGTAALARGSAAS